MIYTIASATNYGTMVHVVRADSAKEAEELAKGHVCPPWEHAEVNEIQDGPKGVILWIPTE